MKECFVGKLLLKRAWKDEWKKMGATVFRFLFMRLIDTLFYFIFTKESCTRRR